MPRMTRVSANLAQLDPAKNYTQVSLIPFAQ